MITKINEFFKNINENEITQKTPYILTKRITGGKAEDIKALPIMYIDASDSDYIYIVIKATPYDIETVEDSFSKSVDEAVEKFNIGGYKKIVQKYGNKDLLTVANILFEELVPDSGAASTIEGEMLRAFTKMEYRYFNDGDYCNVGYGIETCGACYMFLLSNIYTIDNDSEGFHEVLKKLPTEKDDDYEYALDELKQIIARDIIFKNGKLTPYSSDKGMYEKKYKDMAIQKFGQPYDDDMLSNDYEEEEQDY